MFDKDIPGNNCVREETIPVSIRFTHYFAKSVTNAPIEQGSAVGRYNTHNS